MTRPRSGDTRDVDSVQREGSREIGVTALDRQVCSRDLSRVVGCDEYGAGLDGAALITKVREDQEVVGEARIGVIG